MFIPTIYYYNLKRQKLLGKIYKLHQITSTWKVHIFKTKIKSIFALNFSAKMDISQGPWLAYHAASERSINGGAGRASFFCVASTTTWQRVYSSIKYQNRKCFPFFKTDCDNVIATRQQATVVTRVPSSDKWATSNRCYASAQLW